MKPKTTTELTLDGKEIETVVKPKKTAPVNPLQEDIFHRRANPWLIEGDFTKYLKKKEAETERGKQIALLFIVPIEGVQ